MMKIACLGGGVAALYFAIAMKRQDAAAEIDIFERDSRERNSGWGIILREGMLAAMAHTDAASHAEILDGSVSWNVIELLLQGGKIVVPSQFGRSIGRHALVEILRKRAVEMGCTIHYDTPAEAGELAGRYDVLIGADGLKSGCRAGVCGDAALSRRQSANRFVWLGCDKVFDEMVFDFQQTAHGPVWVHAYPFSRTRSTFVVECARHTFDGFGFGRAALSRDIGILQQVFAAMLDGGTLTGLSDMPHEWRRFEQLHCATLYNQKMVLIGDAAHTAHFSIGSGTRLAVEDAIALAGGLHRYGSDLPQAFAHYQKSRSEAVDGIQQQALHSMQWFDRIDAHYRLAPAAFARAFMFRSLGPMPEAALCA